jgi:hypothetical protein
MSFTKVTSAGIGSTELVTLDSLEVINNASIGGVLTYEDVTNVDSIGIITARAGVLVGSGITLSKDGDIFFTGIATGNGSGLTALNASNIGSGTVPTARLGSGTASSSTFLRGDSTFQTVNTDLVSDTSPQLGGNLDTNDKNIVFGDSDGGSGTDNRAVFGAGGDLEIYHDGTNSKIQSETGSLLVLSADFKVQNSSNTETQIKAVENGAVELYHNDSKKFETTTLGATVTRDLTLNHASGDTALRWAVGGTNRFSLYESSNTLRFYDNTNSAERLRIDSSGRLLIGTTTEGSGGADELTIATSGDSGMTIRSGTSSAGAIYFSDGTSGSDEYRGVLSYNHAENAMRFYTDGSEALRIESDGFLKLKADKGLNFANQTITSTSNYNRSTTGEKLDYYEEGIIDPTAVSAGLTFTTDSEKKLRYVRIGHFVSVSGYLAVYSRTSNSTVIQVAMPFTSAPNSSGYYTRGVGAVMYQSITLDSNYDGLVAYVGGGENYMRFFQTRSTNGGWIQLKNSQLTNPDAGTAIYFSINYMVA